MSLFDGRDYELFDPRPKVMEGLRCIITVQVYCKRCKKWAGLADMKVDRGLIAENSTWDFVGKLNPSEFEAVMRRHHKTCTAIVRGK